MKRVIAASLAVMVAIGSPSSAAQKSNWLRPAPGARAVSITGAAAPFIPAGIPGMPLSMIMERVPERAVVAAAASEKPLEAALPGSYSRFLSDPSLAKPRAQDSARSAALQALALAERGTAFAAASSHEVQSLPAEACRARAAEGFDHVIGVKKSAPVAVISAISALSPSIALAAVSAGTGRQSIFQSIANSIPAQAASSIGYYAGNGISFVVDIPRMFEAARSRNTEAISIASNGILMVASILMAARAFMGASPLWAWQNICSGIIPMTIALLQFKKTRRLFPEGPPVQTSPDNRHYPLKIALLRTGIMLLIGLAPALLLGLLGTIYIAPLGSAPGSSLIQFILSTVASGCFMGFLIPQIMKIRKTQSINGVSVWFMRANIALSVGLGLWAANNTLLQTSVTLGKTIGNLDFWNYLVYAVQQALGVYICWLTLKIMGTFSGGHSYTK